MAAWHAGGAGGAAGNLFQRELPGERELEREGLALAARLDGFRDALEAFRNGHEFFLRRAPNRVVAAVVA